MAIKLLIADADRPYRELVAETMRRVGFDIIAVDNGLDAIRLWRSGRPHLVIADITLPKRAGLEVVRAIRDVSGTPIIVVSSERDDRTVVEAFRAGVDDYVFKPFRPSELIMRVRAVLARTEAAGIPSLAEEIELDGVRLDPERKVIAKGERQLQLTPLEFRVAYVLARNHGRVVHYQQLKAFGWRYRDASGSAVSHVISKLRLKLSNLGLHDVIRVVPGVGYEFRLAHHR